MTALGGAAYAAGWEGWEGARLSGPGGAGGGGGSEEALSSSRDLWELCDAVLDDEAAAPFLAAAPGGAAAAGGARARSTSVRIAGRLRPRHLRRRLERGAAERPEDLPEGLRKQASRQSLRAKAAQRTVSLAGTGAGRPDRMRRMYSGG